jgi:hypothetical protein
MSCLLVKYSNNRICNNQVIFAVRTVVAAVPAADLDLDVRVRTRASTRVERSPRRLLNALAQELRLCRPILRLRRICSRIGPSRTGIFRRSRSTFIAAEAATRSAQRVGRIGTVTTVPFTNHCGRGGGVGRGRRVG